MKWEGTVTDCAKNGCRVPGRTRW